jgi:hypothetical protein
MTTKKPNAVVKTTTVVAKKEASKSSGFYGDDLLKAVSVLSASILFSQPQFATQTNPTNILGLADVFFLYMKGEVNVTQPTESAAPTFG